MKRISLLLFPLLILCVIPASASEKGFNDVLPEAWYAEAIQYVHQKNIMNGFSSDEFRPDGIVNRGQLAAILYRAEGSPSTETDNPFSDVSPLSYYASAASWASAKGIILGYTDGTFRGDMPVTHQQAVTILWRYDGSKQTLSESDFEDAGEISKYAVPAINWASSMGFLGCFRQNEKNCIYPSANTSRAEIAYILYRWLQWRNVQEYYYQRNNLILYLSLDENDEQDGYLDSTETVTIEGDIYDAPKLWAKIIHDYAGGDIIPITTKEPYIPLDILSLPSEEYENIISSVKEGKISPQLSTVIDDLDNYDIIFMIYPLWYLMPLDLPEPFYTLFHAYDFSGKVVIPFSLGGNSSIAYGSFQELGGKDIVVFSGCAAGNGIGPSIEYYAKDTLSMAYNRTSKHMSLVASYSPQENTRRIANYIASYTDADSFCIMPLDLQSSIYPDEDKTSIQLSAEQKGKSIHIVSSNSFIVPGFEKYDIIYLGFPDWKQETKEIIKGFLSENNFDGKTIIPFCTSASSFSNFNPEELASMADSGTWKECMVFEETSSAGDVTYRVGETT